MNRPFKLRIANAFALGTSLFAAIGFMLGYNRVANAGPVDGPCPTFEDFSSPCPNGSPGYGVWYGQTCAQGDPLYANGSTYYHCCIYDEYNHHCFDSYTFVDTITGTWEYLFTEAGPGICQSGYGGSYTCLAY